MSVVSKHVCARRIGKPKRIDNIQTSCMTSRSLVKKKRVLQVYLFMQYNGVILRQAIAALFLATDNIVLHPSRFVWLLLWDNYILHNDFRKKTMLVGTHTIRYIFEKTSRFNDNVYYVRGVSVSNGQTQKTISYNTQK